MEKNPDSTTERAFQSKGYSWLYGRTCSWCLTMAALSKTVLTQIMFGVRPDLENKKHTLHALRAGLWTRRVIKNKHRINQNQFKQATHKSFVPHKSKTVTSLSMYKQVRAVWTGSVRVDRPERWYAPFCSRVSPILLPQPCSGAHRESEQAIDRPMHDF